PQPDRQRLRQGAGRPERGAQRRRRPLLGGRAMRPSLFLARVALATVALATVAAVAGCGSQSICNKELECNGDDRNYDDDFVSVCAVTYDGQIRELQANKEQPCQDYAQAKLALDACRSGLD